MNLQLKLLLDIVIEVVFAVEVAFEKVTLDKVLFAEGVKVIPSAVS